MTLVTCASCIPGQEDEVDVVLAIEVGIKLRTNRSKTVHFINLYALLCISL